PRDLARLDIDGAQDFLALFAGHLPSGTTLVTLAGLPLQIGLPVDGAFLQRLYVIKSRGRIERCREPVRRAFHCRADLVSRHSRILVWQKHRTAVRADLL